MGIRYTRIWKQSRGGRPKHVNSIGDLVWVARIREMDTVWPTVSKIVYS